MDIWRDMTTFWGEANVPVLVGKSVHNQRIEHHNRALNEQLLSTFRQQFYELESQGALDVNNDTDIFCLHCVYLPRINKPLTSLLPPTIAIGFQQRTTVPHSNCSGATLRLADHYEGALPQHPNQPNIEELTSQDLPHVYVPDTPNPLGDENFQHVHDFITSLSGHEAKSAYRDVVGFVAEQMM